MKLDLTDEQTATLLGELDRIRWRSVPLSPRIRTLNEIRPMIRPEAAWTVAGSKAV